MVGSKQHRQLKITCEAVAHAGNAALHWAWDDYLGAALAVFPASDSAKVRALLDRALPWSYDAKTAASASPAIAELAESLGGLRTGQLLFASDQEHGALVYGAWWPWGDGKKVSLRVGAACVDGAETEAEELNKELRGWFGI